ncbi:MAG: hypothetical protein AAFN77_07150 [Planctomycetota bacterium]
MGSLGRVSFLAFFLMTCCGLFHPAGISTQLAADEPAEAFVEALQLAGYYDVALEYLEEARNDPNVSTDFKQSIDYKRAQTLIASTRGSRDAELTNNRLNEAQMLLERYAKSNSSIKTQARTFQYIGVLYSSRADIIFRQAESDRLTVDERSKLMAEARALLEKAKTNIAKSKSLIAQLIDPNSNNAIRIDPDDPSTLTELKQMRETYTRVTKLLPEVIERVGDTYAENDPNRNKHYTEAIDLYLKVWDKYRQRYASGIQACVYAARCHQKLGQHKKALERFSDVFALGSGGALKRIKQDAFVLATDSWNQQKPYPHRDVIFVLDPVVRGLTRVELRERNWLKVQLELAIAKHSRAAEIKEAGGPQSNAESKTVDRAAAKLLRNVARVPSPYRDRAKELLALWNVPLVDVAEEQAEPKSFDDALQFARDRIAELESIATENSQLKRNLAAAADEETKQDLAGQIKDVEAQLNQQANTTLGMLDTALTFVDEETSRTDINMVRYLKGFVYFASARYYEAATLGDFQLTHYPSEISTKQASNYTIQSYSVMFDEAAPENEFEYAELKRICDRVLEKFPGSSESGLAASKMCKVALRDNDYEKAREYFKGIPSDYPARGRLGLRLGQLMWIDYKAKIRAKVEPETLKQLLDDACQFMIEGAKQIDPSEVTYDSAVGGLMLVDAKLQQGEVKASYELLESESASPVAPLELIKKQHPAVSQGANAMVFRQEAYKIAIRVYLAAMRQPGANREEWVDKATGVLDDMKQIVAASNDPDGQKRITAVYQLIASELRKGFNEISDQNEKMKYAKTLDNFLTGIQKGAKDGRVVMWAGTTMYKIADEIGKSQGYAEAVPMMKKAVETLDRAEDLGIDGRADSASLQLQLKRYRALARSGSGNFQQAVDDFVKLLSSTKVPVSFQIDAAQTLQNWGKRSQNKDALSQATNGTGTFVDPKTKKKSKAIWGWIRLRSATMRDPKYREIFYTALYGIVEGRFEFGKITNSKKAMNAALSEIDKEKKRNPDFSGLTDWKQKFAELERRIKAEL